MSGNKTPFQVCIKNRQAHFSYTFLDRYTAGLILKGTEIKSIRMGKASLQEAYCYFNRGSLWIKGMHIAAYSYGNIYNHEEKRDRQLLLQKKELQKLLKNQAKGLTIIPIELVINQRGFAKLAIALARGKKLYDKRQAIKERDLERSGQIIIRGRLGGNFDLLFAGSKSMDYTFLLCILLYWKAVGFGGIEF